MDAIEIGRKAAEALHIQAVAIGDDPWKPLAFALSEVKRRDLDAECWRRLKTDHLCRLKIDQGI